MLDKLKKSFIVSGEAFEEGTVAVFEQTICVDVETRAELALTALGMAEAELNGRKVGDEYFTPGFTYYPRELQYQTFPVTLRPGENTLRVYLAQGWYCGRFTFDNKTQIYGDDPAVSWVLEGDGVSATSADASVAMLESPYTYAGLYDGEVFHAGPLATLTAKPQPYTGELPVDFVRRFNSVRLREEMPVKSVTRREDGTTIIDFGQNFAGVVCIDPTKLNGETLKLRHGEILNPDGTLYTTNLRKAKAETVYYKGDSTEIYRPRFTYMGFRYVEMSGAEYVDGLLTAYALYSDMERTGKFSCGNEKVQQLYENQIWGQKSNYVEVPTDCPQRDERMGYTGDGHVFARTGAYNFDTRSFWRKFLADIRYSQHDNTEGYIPSTAPTPSKEPQGIGFLSMLGWGNAVTLIPEMLYWQYGDESFMTEQYDSIKAFVDCECRKIAGTGLWMGPSLGDWLALGRDMAFMAMHNGPVSNAFIVHDLEMASSLAKRMGRIEDAQRWRNQLEQTRAAYISAFIEADGSMKDDYQGAYIMALALVLPKGELYNKVYAKLVEKINAEGMQTGFFATPHILPLLCENGNAGLAFDLLMQPECPGWMYQIDRGATTTWERWDALRPDGTVNEEKSGSDNMVSFNHYSFGSVGEFYYRYILGIQPAEPGFAKVNIRPFVDARLGSVSGSYNSVSGKIGVAWQIADEKVSVQIVTPVPAAVTLPDGSIHEVEPGSYAYEVILK